MEKTNRSFIYSKVWAMVISFFLVIFVLQSAQSFPSYAAPKESDKNDLGKAPKGKKIPDQYIVVLNDDADVNDEAKNAKEKGAQVLHVYDRALKGYAIKANEKALEKIKNNPNVNFIEQDQEVHTFAQVLPTGINRVDGDLSSAISGNGSGTVNVDIAIIDTGIQLNHPDLNVYRQKSLIPWIFSGNDDNGHGTHVAGIAAAKDNSEGVVGIAPGARLWAVKVLDRYGFGSISGIIKGVDYVTQNAGEIDIANMSLGCQCKSAALDTAIHNSVQAGVTYVVAAGNNGQDASSFSPANHPDVITVSAIADTDGKCGGSGPSTPFGKDDTFASFSNYGSVVDLAAPGVSIYSTYKGSTYATISGTSMASPHVAGAAGLYKAANTGASPAEVKSALVSAGSTAVTSLSPSPVALPACDGNGHGYFTGDPDTSAEPLLYVRKI